MALPASEEDTESFDATEYGGAPLLGLNGLVVKTHGSAKAKRLQIPFTVCDLRKEQNINEIQKLKNC